MVVLNHSTPQIEDSYNVNVIYMKRLEDVIGDYEYFISKLLEFIKEKGIDIDNYPIDHICYRVATLKEYEVMKGNIMPFSKSYVENIHHDRPITKFILNNPIKYKNYLISLIELPSLQESHVYDSGLEHFEMVVGDNFDIFKNKYKSIWTGSDDSGPYNQTVFVDFDKYKVKFHKYSLLDVLKLEEHKFMDI